MVDFEELTKDSQNTRFTWSKYHEVIYPRIQVLLDFDEALLEILLEVRCRVAYAFCRTRLHDDAVRRREGEELLAVRVERGLVISTAEVYAREPL